MPVKTRKAFTGTAPNHELELELYVNEKNELYIDISHPDPNETPYGGWITLTADDVDELIKDLQVARQEMEDNRLS